MLSWLSQAEVTSLLGSCLLVAVPFAVIKTIPVDGASVMETLGDRIVFPGPQGQEVMGPPRPDKHLARGILRLLLFRSSGSMDLDLFDAQG